MKAIQRWLGSAVVGVVLAGVAVGQPVPPQPPAEVPPRPVRSDPTVPSPKMQEKLGTRSAEGSGIGAPKLPTLTLKGRVIARDHSAAALVEINGRTHTVTEGASVVVGGTQVLKFVEVSATAVRVEVNAPKEVVILN